MTTGATGAARPLPDIGDPDHAPFWEGTRAHELRVQRCDGCGTHRWLPRARCAECGSFEVSWVAVPGRGTLFSWIVAHQGFVPAFAERVPYVVAIVELDDPPGIRFLGNVLDTPADALQAGMPMEVCFEAVTPEVTLPVEIRRVANPMSDEQPILVERRGAVLLVTLNRPERLNAFTLASLSALWQVWLDFGADDGLRVAVLTGAGDRSFCAGRDLKQLQEEGMADPTVLARYRPPGAPLQWVPLLLPEVPKPTIAAINGYALGGGWALAQRFDLRLAADHAELGLPEARFNLPAGNFVAELVRLVPPAVAAELVLRGERISAQRAYEIGFVNKVVPRAELLPEALRWAEQLAGDDPAVVQAHTELLRRATMPDRETMHALAQHLLDKVRTGAEDRAEVRAFGRGQTDS